MVLTEHDCIIEQEYKTSLVGKRKAGYDSCLIALAIIYYKLYYIVFMYSRLNSSASSGPNLKSNIKRAFPVETVVLRQAQSAISSALVVSIHGCDFAEHDCLAPCHGVARRHAVFERGKEYGIEFAHG